jgi:flagellar hook-length control protein FliK
VVCILDGIKPNVSMRGAMQVNFSNNLQEPSLTGTRAKSVDIKDNGSGQDFLNQMNRSIRETKNNDADCSDRSSDAGRSADAEQKILSPNQDVPKSSPESFKSNPSCDASDDPNTIVQNSDDVKLVMKEVVNNHASFSTSLKGASKQEANNEDPESLSLMAECSDPNRIMTPPNAPPAVAASSAMFSEKSSRQEANNEDPESSSALPAECPNPNRIITPPGVSSADAASSQINRDANWIAGNIQNSHPSSDGSVSSPVPNSWQGELEKQEANFPLDEINASDVVNYIQQASHTASDAGKSEIAQAISTKNLSSGNIHTPQEFQDSAGNKVDNTKFSQSLHTVSVQKSDARSESGTNPENSGTENYSTTLQNTKADARVANSTENRAISGFENIRAEEALAAQKGVSTGSSTGEVMRNRIEPMKSESGITHNQVSGRPQDISSQTAYSTMSHTDAGTFVETASAKSSNTQSRDFIQEVADRIQVQVRDGKGEIRVQLKPESLGRVEIRAESTALGVVAKITTESKEVKNYLENNMHVLQQSLQDQGLKVERIEFAVQNGFDDFGAAGHHTQSGHTGSGNSGGKTQNAVQSAGTQIESQIEESVSDAMTRVVLNPNIRFHAVA